MAVSSPLNQFRSITFSCPCSIARPVSLPPKQLPAMSVSQLYPPRLPIALFATIRFRLKVTSMLFVGAQLTSLPKKVLSFAPPSPVSMVDWPAQRKTPSPPWVIEL
jgi:hypothetical protein